MVLMSVILLTSASATISATLTTVSSNMINKLLRAAAYGSFCAAAGAFVFLPLFFLLQFRDMDFSDRECQRRLVSTFVNAIYLYDDKIILTFNYSGDSRTVTLAEIDAVTEGEVFGCCAPWSAKRKPPIRVAFLFGRG